MIIITLLTFFILGIVCGFIAFGTYTCFVKERADEMEIDNSILYLILSLIGTSSSSI